MPNLMEEFERSFEEMFKDLEIPKEMIREKRLPTGGTEKENCPFFFGYSFSVGTDGKPVIKEFGKVKPSLPKRAGGKPKGGPYVCEGRGTLGGTNVLDAVLEVV